MAWGMPAIKVKVLVGVESSESGLWIDEISKCH